MSAISTAMLALIERNDIVVQVARIIDPGAFGVAFDGTGSDAKKLEPSTRQRYAQSVALNKAQHVVQMLAKFGNQLAVLAADSEAQGWIDMGIPANTPELRKIIDQKYTA